MRFLTFVQQLCNETWDDDIIVFAGWIFTAEYSRKNRQAGAPQVQLYIRTQPCSGQVKDGFYKAVTEYYEHPDNMLPLLFKKDCEEFESFAQAVYQKW